LVYDIGRKSGCGASLVSLRRLSSDGFDISQAHTLDELKSGNISDYLITVEEEFSYLNNIFLSEKQSVRFLNGGNISRISSNENGLYRVYSPEKKFLGLGTFGSDGLKPEKLFF
jgi:tRNA pseudouridine55 synthase